MWLSSWLRVKFGFSPSTPAAGGNEQEENARDVLEIDLADGSQLDLVDVTSSSGAGGIDSILPAESEHSQVGLVIFETSPIVAQAKTAASSTARSSRTERGWVTSPVLRPLRKSACLPAAVGHMGIW